MAISGDKKRDYMRNYMRDRRAEAREGKAKAKPASKTAKAAPAGDSAALQAARAEIARLRAENARLQAELTKHASPAPKATAKPEAPKATAAKPLNWLQRELAEWEKAKAARLPRLEASDTASARAQRKGFHISLAVGQIERLLHRRCPDEVIEVIIKTMIQHTGDQINIDKGIPRGVYRKVLADLSPDRAPGNEDAFRAFKDLDLKKGNADPYRGSIIIRDEKVETFSGEQKKREERSAKAKAARAATAKAK